MTVLRAAPAAPTARRAAAGVKADRRSPEGLGLDTGEDQRTLTPARSAITPGPADPASAAADNKIDLHRITHIMPLSGWTPVRYPSAPLLGMEEGQTLADCDQPEYQLSTPTMRS